MSKAIAPCSGRRLRKATLEDVFARGVIRFAWAIMQKSLRAKDSKLHVHNRRRERVSSMRNYSLLALFLVLCLICFLVFEASMLTCPKIKKIP